MTVPKFIDTHHHLWDLENNPYPWLQEGIKHFVGDYSPIKKTYLISDLIRDSAGLRLEKSVHVQAEWDHNLDPVGETEWLQRVADDSESNNMPNAIIGYADLSNENVERTLERHSRFRNWRGIRDMLNWSDDPNLRFAERGNLMADENWLKGYRLLAKYGGSFDLQIWPWQFEDSVNLARKVPDVPIILDHTGMPIGRTDEDIRTWKSGMKKFGDEPNTSVKISALGMLDKNWTADSIRPFVLDTIEAAGINKCMFASNFPVDSLFSDYATIWRAYDEITEDFSEEERAALFHDNAEKYYRI
jgi:predicted TIM-barrel fold metal-dependent hydrolase